MAGAGTSQRQRKAGLCRETSAEAALHGWGGGASRGAFTQEQGTTGTAGASEHGCSTGTRSRLSSCCSDVLRHSLRRNVLPGGLSWHPSPQEQLLVQAIPPLPSHLAHRLIHKIVCVTMIPGNKLTSTPSQSCTHRAPCIQLRTATENLAPNAPGAILVTI